MMANNARYCGDCENHNPDAQTCALSLSYAAWVLVDTPANDCPGYHDRDRAVAEAQAQSEVRGPMPGMMGLWQNAWGKKP